MPEIGEHNPKAESSSADRAGRSRAEGEDSPLSKARSSFANLRRQRWFWPVAIFLIALVVRVHFFVALGRQWGVYSMPRKDAQEWDCLAMNILLGRGYVDYLLFFKYHTLQVPFLSIFLSFLYSYVGHSWVAAKGLQLLLSSLTCVFVFKTMEMALGHRKAAILSGILCALYLPYIRYAHDLMTETLFIFFFVVSVYFVLASVSGRSTKKAILGGVFGGLATLTRAAMSSLWVLFAIWYLIVFRKELKAAIRIGCVALACFALVVSPWLVRSYVIHGAPIMASIGNLQLWTGSNPVYDGAFYGRAPRRRALWKKPGASEGDRSKMLTREAIHFILENPYRYLEFCSRRYSDFWRISRPRLEKFKPTPHNFCRSLPTVIFPLAPLGMILGVRKRKELSLLLGAVLFFSGAHAVFGAVERYRIPLDWIFIGYASLFLCFLFGKPADDLSSQCGVSSEDATSASDLGPTIMQRASIRTGICWKVLLAVFVVMLAIYLIGMARLYIFAQGKHFEGYGFPRTERIEEALKKCGLLSLWEEQGRKTPSVYEIFRRRAESGDYDSDYPRWIVVWTGEMRYIFKSKDGTISRFRLYVNAKGQHLGEGQFPCLPAWEAEGVPGSSFREGDVATVVGYTEGQVLGAPYIRFVGIIPYEGGI